LGSWDFYSKPPHTCLRRPRPVGPRRFRPDGLPSVPASQYTENSTRCPEPG